MDMFMASSFGDSYLNKEKESQIEICGGPVTVLSPEKKYASNRIEEAYTTPHPTKTNVRPMPVRAGRVSSKPFPWWQTHARQLQVQNRQLIFC